MIVSSHLLMSRILYKYCLYHLNFKLDKQLFMYGNIKPDFHEEEIKAPHFINDSINNFVDFSKNIRQSNLAIDKFSLKLGVICHFTCDYFCLYHKDDYKDRDSFRHTLYEIRLHIVLLFSLLTGKTKIIEDSESQEDVMILLEKNYEMYLNEKDSLSKDIKYALLTTAAVVRCMICFSNVKSNNMDYFKLEAEGGKTV